MNKEQDQNQCVYFYKRGSSYYEFSNFWSAKDHQKKYKKPLNLRIDGKIWRTTEAYYQAQKFPSCPEYQEIIREADSPGKVYKLGQKRAPGYKWKLSKNDPRIINNIIALYSNKAILRVDWDQIKDSIMKIALSAKFNQNKDLGELLLSTGKKTLIENSPYDKYWGIGSDKSGQNKLGLFLMKVRLQLTCPQSACLQSQEKKEIVKAGLEDAGRPPQICDITFTISDDDPIWKELGL